MEIENHKEEVPFAYYLKKYQSLDPEEAAQRLNILYDANTKKFHFRFMGHEYEADYPEFALRVDLGSFSIFQRNVTIWP